MGGGGGVQPPPCQSASVQPPHRLQRELLGSWHHYQHLCFCWISFSLYKAEHNRCSPCAPLTVSWSPDHTRAKQIINMDATANTEFTRAAAARGGLRNTASPIGARQQQEERAGEGEGGHLLL